MCSTFVKITKLSQEERFMCLLLTQSFPRYFLSIPPKLNPAQTAAIFVSTQHQPNALESHWQLHVAWHGALLRGWAGVPSQSSSIARHRFVLPLCWEQESVPHLAPAGTQAQEPGWPLLPTQLSNLCPRLNSCKGKISGSFLKPREWPCDSCLCLWQRWGAFSNIVLRDLWNHRNQLSSPEQVKQHVVAPQLGDC